MPTPDSTPVAPIRTTADKDDGPAVSVTVPGKPICSVVISTKNRKQELENAIASVLAQNVPLEVIVINDASNDGTEEMVLSKFPQVRYDKAPVSLGLIVQRNRGALMARTPIIVSIDDDATFPTTNIVEHSIRELNHPRVGAVGIPYIDIFKTDGVRQLAPDDRDVYILPTYVGTAHVLRRDLFLRLGSYRAIHLHQGEEGDLCLRMLQAGYVVRAGTSQPIHHLESPKRDFTRMFENNARNHILYAWHNIPMPYMPVRMLGMTFNLVRWGIKRKYNKATQRGIWRGYRDMFMGKLDPRVPVSKTTYAVSRMLYKRLTPIRLSEIEAKLPPAEPLPPISV